MSFFKRVSEILAANINEILDRMENPGKMIKQLIREMEDAVAESKEDLVKALADQKKVEKEIAAQKEKLAQWQERAIAAVQKGREDLARKALEFKMECRDILRALEPQLEVAREASEAAKVQVRALEAKWREARRKQAVLAARLAAAGARKKASGAPKGRGKKSPSAVFAEFERMQDKVAIIEAEAEAMAQVSTSGKTAADTFADAEASDEIDRELADLTKTVGESRP